VDFKKTLVNKRKRTDKNFINLIERYETAMNSKLHVFENDCNLKNIFSDYDIYLMRIFSREILN
jgi:hypothetical protein